MARLSVLLVPLAFALVVAETAFYVPKSFYVIDPSGAVSAPVMLLGRLGLRSRRAALPQSVSSSSSSSSSSGTGFGHSFSTSSSSSNGNGGAGGFGYADPGYSGHYQPGYSAPPVVPLHHPGPQVVETQLYNRFSDDGSVSGVGLTGTSTGGNGVFSGSSSSINSDGKVHFSTHTGKF